MNVIPETMSIALSWLPWLPSIGASTNAAGSKAVVGKSVVSPSNVYLQRHCMFPLTVTEDAVEILLGKLRNVARRRMQK